MKTQAIVVIVLICRVFLVQCIPLLEEEIDKGEWIFIS